MFNFVVRYFSFLKFVPIVPWVFDAMMMLWNFLFNPRLLELIEKVEVQVSTWPGIHTSIHKFGGLQFNFNKKEIGHIHSNGLLDILFSKKIKSELILKGRARDHHIFKDSGWVSFYIKDESDLEEAMSLLKLSYDIKTGLSSISL
jgi:hypothetical protein